MLFNSIAFVFFFIIVTSLYFIIPYRLRWLLLLAASCYFYMAFVPVYILILGFTIIIDYFAGIQIEEAKGRRRKMYLWASLVANIGVLAVFKYYNFINENITLLLGNFQLNNPIPYLSILLPIGLSFHTFQAMSYTIEVYRGNQKAERDFGIYSLYVLFYPQLVAGPIERPQNLLPQFRTTFNFEYVRVTEGLKIMLWGFFKKLVVADRLALYVNTAYGNPEQHSGLTLLVATFFFAFQIYCDFSGYSDIAIGSAKVMGFELMTNFKRPFFSRSIAEFWRRWHISLSTWFKDYLYIPLGGNRRALPRAYVNLLIVFLVSGLWHGASWNYVIFGGLNGFYIVFSLITLKYRTVFNDWLRKWTSPKLVNFLQIITTFSLILFAFIVFRSGSMHEAFLIIRKIGTFRGEIFMENPSMMIFSLSAVAILLLADLKTEYYRGSLSFFHNKSWAIRNLSYAALIILILLFGVFDGGQFIYFQF